MIKVITYGTYDLLHYGHIRLLQRAKSLGDYLIVGVTADDFDKVRGKINVQQSLMERVEAVRQTGLADEIIIEEYEGQKIDDIKRYAIDIFTVGSDWVGKFDYLNEYCKVVYLDRTQGISSSEIRNKDRDLLLGLVGDSKFLDKVFSECSYVNGINICGICTNSLEIMSEGIKQLPLITNNFDELLSGVDAVYIRSQPVEHYEQIKKALCAGKHVICESPVTLVLSQFIELQQIASDNNLILMEAIKTAYSMAYNRLLLLLKSGVIGDVVSVDATCTSLEKLSFLSENRELQSKIWNGIYEWAPTALLPVFQILGTKYIKKSVYVKYRDAVIKDDSFVKVDFYYNSAVATIKVGNGVKSEGELIISGTKGYVYVPAPWWKTDYYEVRFENATNNKRCFYQLDGEGIRNELVVFAKEVQKKSAMQNIGFDITSAISSFMEDYTKNKDVILLN